MSAAVDFVKAAFAGRLPEGATVDMDALFADEALQANLARVIDDTALVEFATPDGGFMGDMAGPFRGHEGLRAGWAEWLAPWDSFLFEITEWIDAGNGLVLLLGQCRGRLSGSGLELDTPAAGLYEVRDGLITRIQHFLDQDQARRVAGLD